MTDGKSARGASIIAIVAWCGLTSFAILSPTSEFARMASFMAIVALVAFCLVHSTRRLGIGHTLVLFALAVVIANIYENLSIATGFPFGSYVHTAASGPKIFQVPIIVGPIFYSVGYIAWTLATMILGEPGRPQDRLRYWGIPVVAAFIVTGWDICSDPIGATIGRQWIFAKSGAYYGVPLANYLGWYLCTWTFFQAWSIYLSSKADLTHEVALKPSYWYEASAFWALISLQYPLLWLANPISQVVKDTGNWAWRSGDILQAAVIMSIYTMLAAAAMGTLAVAARVRELPDASGKDGHQAQTISEPQTP